MHDKSNQITKYGRNITDCHDAEKDHMQEAFPHHQIGRVLRSKEREVGKKEMCIRNLRSLWK